MMMSERETGLSGMAVTDQDNLSVVVPALADPELRRQEREVAGVFMAAMVKAQAKGARAEVGRLGGEMLRRVVEFRQRQREEAAKGLMRDF